MKFNRILAILLAATAFLLTSCKNDEVNNTGIDSSKPGVTDFAYDEINSSNDAIAFMWDASQAVKAGATSFTVQLMQTTDGSDASNYESSLAQTVQVTDNPNDGVIINGHKKGQKYTVRARANYRESKFSDWTWLMNGSDTAVVKVGVGVVNEDLNVLGAPDVQLKEASSRALNVEFSATTFIDAQTDIKYDYTVKVYKDAACTDLLVGYLFPSTMWQKAVTGETISPSFIFTCLEPATTYYFKVSYTDASRGEETNEKPVALTTLADDRVLMSQQTPGSAAPGQVILHETFDELPWGGDYVLSSPGISSGSRGKVEKLYVPTGDHFSTNTLPYLTSAPAATDDPDNDFYFCAYSVEVGIFNTMGKAVRGAESSVAEWYQLMEGSSKGVICEKPGYLKMGASKQIGMIVTPQLTALSGPATVEVTFKGCPYGGSSLDPLTVGVAVLNGIKVSNTTNYVTETIPNVVTSANTVGVTLTGGYSWKEYTVTVPNVLPTSYIAIGPTREDGTAPGANQHRMFLDDISVKVVEYGTITLDVPSNVKAEPTDKTIAVSWDAVNLASGYTVEYKKASDSDWTSINVETNSATIEGLEEGTAYQVRVKATMGSSESDYSETVDVSTLVPAGLRTEIATGEQLVDWLSKVDATATDTYKLTADIDMTGLTITSAAGFPGTFDGQGHSIKNLTSTVPLFSDNKGTIQNVVIDASSKFTPSAKIFGTIADRSSGAIVSCTNNASVTYSVDDETETVLMAGIVGASTGAITDCHNTGAISITSAKGVVGGGASGIAGFASGAVSGSINDGAVTVTSLYTNKKTNVESVKSALPGAAGIVVVAGEGNTISNCTNNGAITFTQTEIDHNPLAGKSNLNRHEIGGIVANAFGDVTGSTNTGVINVTLRATAKYTGKSHEYIVCVGGIGGGDALATGTAVSSYSNCSNSGAITVEFDAQQSNSAIGGVVGWPGSESGATTKVTNCTNSGNLTIKGDGKGRIGGIEGGSGNVEGCTNTGAIVVESTSSASVVGGIAGFHGGGYSFENNVERGTITVNCTIDAIGGLMGNVGDQNLSTTKSSKVDCTISGKDTDLKVTGLVVGKFNALKGEHKVTLGTESDPIKVKGSVNGTTVDSSNYGSYLNGSTNVSSGHTINAAYGD